MEPCACLLIHGFGGSPFEMEPVARVLEAGGHACSLPTLPGHDATVEQWSRTGWQDWLAHVEGEYDRLEARHGRVCVMGLSMGGSLSLALAQRRRPAGVVTLAAPVFLYQFFPPRALDWRLPLTGLLRKIRPIWPKDPKTGESRAMAPWKGYEHAVALDALYSFMQALPGVRRDLPRIAAPLLAVHSPLDRYVPYANLWEITSRVSSPRRQAVTLAIREKVTRHHMLTTHLETRDEVAGLCLEFAARLSGQGF